MSDEEDFTHYLQDLGLTPEDFDTGTDFTSGQQDMYDLGLDQDLQQQTAEQGWEQLNERRGRDE